jgi:hypothetical protein
MTDLAKSMAERGRTTFSNSSTTSSVHLHRTPVARVARPRIGQLLLEAGIVKPHSLHQALHLAKESQQQVGRVLVGLGFLNERELNNALLVQSLIGEGAVNEQTAIKAVREAAAKRVNVTEILKDLAEETRTIQDDGGLGGLLVAGGIITQPVLEEAINKSQQSGVLLGRTLLVMHAITTSMLDTALTVLVLLRDTQVSKDEAVRLLREVRRSNCSLTDAVVNLRIKVKAPSKARLGEILALSKLLSESETTVAVERAILEKRMLGEILVTSGSIEAKVLDSALNLQLMVTRGLLTVAQAAHVLQRAHLEQRPIRDVAIELNLFNQNLARGGSVVTLLKQANLISNSDVNTAMLEYEDYRMPACQALLASGRLEPSIYSAAIECVDMIERNMITQAQGIIALDICQRTRSTVSMALASMGLAPGAKTEAQTKKVDTVQTRAVTTVSEWNSFAEFKILIGLVILALAVDFAATKFAPEDIQMTVYYASLVVVAMGLMKLGYSWKRSGERREDDRKQHLTVAQQTKTRLEKRR